MYGREGRGSGGWGGGGRGGRRAVTGEGIMTRSLL